MNTLNYILLIASSLVLTLFAIKVFTFLAPRLGLVDRPNSRKVHSKQVPVVGGISIFAGIILTALINSTLFQAASQHIVAISTAFILLLIGVFDDKLNLSARFRLILQFLGGWAVYLAGYRITSLHGLLGIYEIHPVASLAITLILIAGVVNAFNLIDGIDGLAGFIATIGLATFAWLAYHFDAQSTLVILIVLVLALLMFLRSNLSKNKIFLGDGGSLFIGFLMVCFGIELINQSINVESTIASKSPALVIAVFLIPVVDSLRVYWTRINNGFSPFKADKSHIHHLFLGLNLPHKKAALAIAALAIVLIGSASMLISSFGITLTILVLIITALIVMTVLSALKNLNEWSEKIKALEN